MHCTNLMWGQGFIEEVDGGHLASKYPFFVYVWCTSNVAFVKRLQKKGKKCKNNVLLIKVGKNNVTFYFLFLDTLYVSKASLVPQGTK